MSFTTDPNHPDLGHGADQAPVPQNKVYLVLSPEETAKGFVRRWRNSYVHVGKKPTYPIRDLTEEEGRLWGDHFAKFEPYPSGTAAKGQFWTQKDLDNKGCGTQTMMADRFADTYAREPKFYGSTYCCGCSKHLPVAEFVWDDGEVVGS